MQLHVAKSIATVKLPMQEVIAVANGVHSVSHFDGVIALTTLGRYEEVVSMAKAVSGKK